MTQTHEPARLAAILEDILSSPRINNGEFATATDYLTEGSLGLVDSVEAATLAAARYCWQLGGLAISRTPG